MTSIILAMTLVCTSGAQAPSLQNSRDVYGAIGTQDGASSRMIAKVQFSCASVAYANVNYFLHSQQPSGTSTDTFIDAVDSAFISDHGLSGILAVEIWLNYGYRDSTCRGYRYTYAGWALERRFVNISTGEAQPFERIKGLTGDEFHPASDTSFNRYWCPVPWTNWRYPLTLGIHVEEYASGVLADCCQQRGPPHSESLRMFSPICSHSFVAHDATMIHVSGKFNSEAQIDAVWVERTTGTEAKTQSPPLGLSRSAGDGSQGDVMDFHGDVPIQGGQNYMQMWARDSCGKKYLMKSFYVSTVAANVAANPNPNPG